MKYELKNYIFYKIFFIPIYIIFIQKVLEMFMKQFKKKIFYLITCCVLHPCFYINFRIYLLSKPGK